MESVKEAATSEGASSVDAYSSRMSPSPLPSDHWTILDEKRSRKQIEDDTVRLRNRVRTLQKEEERVRRQISHTEAKIERTVKTKQAREQREAEKDIRKQIEKRQITQRREKNARLREESQRVRKEKETQILEEKLHMAHETKNEKLLQKRLLVEDQEVHLKKAQDKKKSVKNLESEIQRKLKQHRNQKRTQAQEDYEKRLEEERHARMVKEQELAELMQLEFSLIEKLKIKQQEQEKQHRKLKDYIKQKPKHDACLNGDPPKLVQTNMSGEGKRRDVMQLLRQYDPSQSGVISASDLHHVLDMLGGGMKEDQRAKTIHSLDPSQKGSISHERFLAWWTGHKATKLLSDHSVLK